MLKFSYPFDVFMLLLDYPLERKCSTSRISISVAGNHKLGSGRESYGNLLPEQRFKEAKLSGHDLDSEAARLQAAPETSCTLINSLARNRLQISFVLCTLHNVRGSSWKGSLGLHVQQQSRALSQRFAREYLGPLVGRTRSFF